MRSPIRNLYVQNDFSAMMSYVCLPIIYLGTFKKINDVSSPQFAKSFSLELKDGVDIFIRMSIILTVLFTLSLLVTRVQNQESIKSIRNSSNIKTEEINHNESL
jgi:hypothetical protein